MTVLCFNIVLCWCDAFTCMRMLRILIKLQFVPHKPRSLGQNKNLLK